MRSRSVQIKLVLLLENEQVLKVIFAAKLFNEMFERLVLPTGSSSLSDNG